MLFVALGTGIAAAVITRGQVSTGATGRAGELRPPPGISGRRMVRLRATRMY